MNKRSITGWRQVPPAANSLRRRSSAARSAVAAHPPVEPPPKAQWETEGGTVAAPAKQVRK